MKILAVETSGKTFSSALGEEWKISAEFFYDCGHIHSEMLIPAIERLLKDTGNSYKTIDKFAVSTGPGSFTGIRVGMTAVKMMAQSLSRPVIAVDTLTILEKTLQIKNVKIVPAIDALRNEVYVKSGGKIIIKSVESFIKGLMPHKGKALIIGNAAVVYKEKLSKSLGAYSVSLPEAFHMPKASVLGMLALTEKGADYAEAKPLYIRRSWAEESKK
jgi:tRNA threonylcarbamoyladenosine biosynthesis protein TsaB